MPSRRLFPVLPIVLALAGCAPGGSSGVSLPFLHASRITVQDLTAPAVAAVGAPARIRFRLVRVADEGAPIYWTAHFVERPAAAGGALSASSGGPVRSGEFIEMTYTPASPAVALITLYPSSTPGTPIGDGSGDWRSFTIEAR